VEKIAELEKEYDFTGLSVKKREEAKKWFKGRPTLFFKKVHHDTS
jgi:hypothetical protein